MSSASAVTVWRWVDQNGVVHYSDRPVDGAERVELSSAQTFAAPPPTAATAPPASTENASPSPAAMPYRRFDIVSPAQQETLWNIGGALQVQLQLEPPLQAGNRIDVYLDGERRHLDATAPQITVPEVERGVHTLQGVVLDESGTELLRTLAVTFMVQQTSILNPNNPTPPARRN